MKKKITEFVEEAISSWGQTFSILATIVLCTYTMFSEMKRIETRVDVQGARTDRLYEMFIDLLKEQRK